MAKKLIPLTKTEIRLLEGAARRRESLIHRFPLVFGLTATFGLVSVLYGFEKIIDQVPLFVNNPWILLIVGLTLLIITGAAYRKLN